MDWIGYAWTGLAFERKPVLPGLKLFFAKSSGFVFFFKVVKFEHVPKSSCETFLQSRSRWLSAGGPLIGMGS